MATDESEYAYSQFIHDLKRYHCVYIEEFLGRAMVEVSLTPTAVLFFCLNDNSGLLLPRDGLNLQCFRGSEIP